MYTMKYYSTVRKDEIIQCAWMILLSIASEVNHIKRGRHNGLSPTGDYKETYQGTYIENKEICFG